MNIVFMGTAEFAVPSLKVLLEFGHVICGVVTQPDKPRGRGHKVSLSPVKEYALEHGLNMFQPDKIKSPDAMQQVAAWAPELVVVVAYGQIIPEAMLTLPHYGCINVHGSLLPRYRGAAPIQRALMAGEKVTGVTTMYMDKGLDTGDMIKQADFSVDDQVDYGELQQRLALIGADLLIKTIKDITAGTAQRVPQDSTQATYAPALNSSDEVICWQNPAMMLHNQVRALSPRPGAYTTYEGSKIKVYRSRVASSNGAGPPGMIASEHGKLLVQTGQGWLELLEVQKEGRKRMSARDFMAGQRNIAGVVLGS